MRAVVVGSGIGGLATAIRLRKLGYKVIILEKNEKIGGRMDYIENNGYFFDTGPTLLLMLKPLIELFKEVEENINDYLNLVKIDPLYRIYFKDGSFLEPSNDLAYYVRQVALKEFKNLLKFYSDITYMYNDTIYNFVEKNYYSVFDFLNLRSVKLLLKHKMLDNLYYRVSRYFDDYRLIFANTFQSMYLGISPFNAPFVYTVVNYMEAIEGIYYPIGGMYQIVKSLEKIISKMNIRILRETEVKEIDKKTNTIYTNKGFFDADVIVINADLPYAKSDLLNEKLPNYDYSCSTIMLYIGYEGSTNMLHHNVFLTDNYKQSFESIFNKGIIPNDLSFYVNISSKTDISQSPKNCENIYILIPVPNLKVLRENLNEKLNEIINKVFDRLESQTNFRRERIKFIIKRTPYDWQSLYNLKYGSAFGLSHKFLQSAYFRPKNYEKKGIYYVGASTIPGSGIPMVLISSKLVIERILKDYGNAP
jgi:phytoene desaturase